MNQDKSIGTVNSLSSILDAFTIIAIDMAVKELFDYLEMKPYRHMWE